MEREIKISKELIGKSIKAYKFRNAPGLLYYSQKEIDLSQLVIGKIIHVQPTRKQILPRVYADGFILKIEGKDGQHYRMQTSRRAVLNFFD